MRAVIQRVSDASITINGENKKCMGKGLVVLLGVSSTDTKDETIKLAKKIAELRIFEDENDKMNLSALELNLEIMVVSQFTLFADTKKGRRPSFIKAGHPDMSKDIYEKFLNEIKEMDFKNVVNGEFGADMQINLTNDGPVTIIIDTDEWKNMKG